MLTNEIEACFALRFTKGIGPSTCKRLLLSYGTALCAVEDVHNWAKLKIVNIKIVKNFIEKSWLVEFQQCKDIVQKKNIKVLCFSDVQYPAQLKQIPNPPICLFYIGNLNLLQGVMLGIVGARSCSRYGADTALKLSKELSNSGISIVSGLAEGIDRNAHIGGLLGIGSTIAVLGNGLDILYPISNRDIATKICKEGLILTEFPPGTESRAENFPYRNRIISGLSVGVVVVEAAIKSGSLITAKLATEHGREVFIVPGPLNNARFLGSHSLVRDGAILIRDYLDILQDIAPQLLVAKDNIIKNDELDFSHLSEQEQKIMTQIPNTDSVHIDTLIAKLNFDTAEISSSLLMLELNGLIRQLPGMFYVRELAK